MSLARHSGEIFFLRPWAPQHIAGLSPDWPPWELSNPVGIPRAQIAEAFLMQARNIKELCTEIKGEAHNFCRVGTTPTGVPPANGRGSRSGLAPRARPR